jgi:hypothetical protein
VPGIGCSGALRLGPNAELRKCRWQRLELLAIAFDMSLAQLTPRQHFRLSVLASPGALPIRLLPVKYGAFYLHFAVIVHYKGFAWFLRQRDRAPRKAVEFGLASVLGRDL